MKVGFSHLGKNSDSSVKNVGVMPVSAHRYSVVVAHYTTHSSKQLSIRVQSVLHTYSDCTATCLTISAQSVIAQQCVYCK
jgi:hypothetical protein